jgi:putative two-component system response regulator
MTEKNKILIAEDDLAQRMLLRMTLEGEGYEVIEAENGLEALARRDEHSEYLNLRLLITDLSMPELDGFELIKTIREREVHYTYIIVLTSNDDDGSLMKALALGADDFLTKPVKPEELKLRLQGGLRLLRLESQEELIFSMAKMAEYRSDETGYHLERVQRYTQLFARDLIANAPEFNLTIQLADEIARVSPLHDIGKIAIVDNILHKPEQLTAEEFKIMKTHTRIGGDLLQDIFKKTRSSYMKLAHEIALCHHEKYNGKGYPNGLKGDEIPVAARIMALADIYDAMSSKRCYKEAFSHEKIKKIILEEKGEHLDPRVVDAFLRQEDLVATIREKFQD